MGVMAFTTVLINGGTIKLLLQRLGFMSHTAEQVHVLEHVVRVRFRVGWPQGCRVEGLELVVQVWVRVGLPQGLGFKGGKTSCG